MAKGKVEMVYMLVHRNLGNPHIYGTGGFTRELFVPKLIFFKQSAEKEYVRALHTEYNPDLIKTGELDTLSDQRQKAYFEYLLGNRPACLAFELQNFRQMLDEWLLYPTEITEAMTASMESNNRAYIEVRQGFIEKYRLYDIGVNLDATLSFYLDGKLETLC